MNGWISSASDPAAAVPVEPAAALDHPRAGMARDRRVRGRPRLGDRDPRSETVASPFRLVPRAAPIPSGRRAARGDAGRFRDTAAGPEGRRAVRRPVVARRRPLVRARDARPRARRRGRQARERAPRVREPAACRRGGARAVDRAGGRSSNACSRSVESSKVSSATSLHATRSSPSGASRARPMRSCVSSRQSRVETDLRESELALMETRSALAKLGHEMAMREAENAERERQEAETSAKSRSAPARSATRSRAASATTSRSRPPAPASACARVRAPGAVVGEE